MAVLKHKPTSPGIRHKISLLKKQLCKNNRLLKKNIYTLKKNVGRSTQSGHITVRHKGGGRKRSFRSIKYSDKINIFVLISVFYDPNRNAFIALNFSLIDYTFNFIIQTEYGVVGAFIESFIEQNSIRTGNTLKLQHIPAGSIIHSVNKNRKIVYAKSAGTFCQIIQKTDDFVKIKLPSGNIFTAKNKDSAIIGSVSNKDFINCYLGKAGTARHNKKRPAVRGVAMNPVDHPHGGRTNGGRPSVSPWGKLTKGVPTRKKKQYV